MRIEAPLSPERCQPFAGGSLLGSCVPLTARHPPHRHSPVFLHRRQGTRAGATRGQGEVGPGAGGRRPLGSFTSGFTRSSRRPGQPLHGGLRRHRARHGARQDGGVRLHLLRHHPQRHAHLHPLQQVLRLLQQAEGPRDQPVAQALPEAAPEAASRAEAVRVLRRRPPLSPLTRAPLPPHGPGPSPRQGPSRRQAPPLAQGAARPGSARGFCRGAGAAASRGWRGAGGAGSPRERVVTFLSVACWSLPPPGAVSKELAAPPGDGVCAVVWGTPRTPGASGGLTRHPSGGEAGVTRAAGGGDRQRRQPRTPRLLRRRAAQAVAGGGRGEDPQKRLRLCVLQPTPPAGGGPGPGCSHGGCRLRGEPSREPQRPPNRARTQQGSPGPCRGRRPQHRLLMWGEEGTLPGALSPARAGGTGPWGVQGPLPAGWGVRYLLLDGALGLLLRARWHCPALRPRGRGGQSVGHRGRTCPGVRDRI